LSLLKKKCADPEGVSLVPLLPDEVPEEGGPQLGPEGGGEGHRGLPLHPCHTTSITTLVNPAIRTTHLQVN